MEILVAVETVALLLVLGYVIRFIPPKKEEKTKLSEEDKEKLERTKEAFQNLMGYDEKSALKRK